MNINDFINSLSNELIKNNFHYIEISKDFNRYEVETYYKDKKIIEYFKSDIIYNGEQIEKLIDNYLKEYNIEKTIYYK